MSLKDFLSSIVPHFERNRILEDIDSLCDDLSTTLIPSYKAAAKLFSGRKFTSDAGKSMEAMFHVRFPKERNINHVSFTLANLDSLLETLKLIESNIDKYFDRDVTRDALTYKRAAVLQFLSVARFYNDYAGRHLLRLVANEDAAFKASNGANGVEFTNDSGLLPADKKFFQANLENFLHASQIVAIGGDQIMERLNQMQDLQIVLDRINTVTATLGVENVDPLRLGFMGPNATSSPIYKIRAAIANYQVATNNRNKELSKLLQLRLFALKDAYEFKNDPKLQREIEYNEERLHRLNQSVAEFEEQYA